MNPDLEMRWLLLIYTVPRSPSRLRATIWRELKKVGAVYLRDGVCALPEREATQTALTTIATRVREFGGQASLATAHLDPESSTRIVEEASAARASEYTELTGDAERFLEHVAREREHRKLTYAEVEELEGDLEKLRRWFEQMRARDYFPVAAEQERVTQLLGRCDDALGAFLDEVYTETETDVTP